MCTLYQGNPPLVNKNQLKELTANATENTSLGRENACGGSAKNLDERPNFWVALRDERREDIDEVLGGVDGCGGNCVDRLTAFFQKDGACYACRKAGGEVF
jgi:hypothetical protein